jgi:hypothetical protein
MPPKTAVELKASTTAKRNERIAAIQLKSKTDDEYRADINAWINDLVTIPLGATSSKLDKHLTTAAESERSSYNVESPVFINTGKTKIVNLPLTNPATYSYPDRQNSFREYQFRDFLKSLSDPLTRFRAAVGAGITVTEIEPTVFLSSTAPVFPQNVVFRYRFSW